MTNKKIVYSFDPQTGEYRGEATAWESPLEPSVYHIPANTTEIKPILEDGKLAKWNGEKWENNKIEEKPIEEQKETSEQKKARIKNELIQSRKDFLTQTIDYVMQEFDLPGTYPKDIKTKRIQAWKEIRQIQDAKTLTSLNEFTSTFD